MLKVRPNVTNEMLTMDCLALSVLHTSLLQFYYVIPLYRAVIRT
jgi:hypothetical protein